MRYKFLIFCVFLLLIFLSLSGCFEKSSDEENIEELKLQPELVLQNTSDEFVDTIAGILSSGDVSFKDEDIEDLEEIISFLSIARENISTDANVSLNYSLIAKDRLKKFHDGLNISLVDFSNLAVVAPEIGAEKSVILSGIWIRETRLALMDIEQFKDDGANNILINVPLDADFDFNFTVPTMDAIGFYVNAIHKSGMCVTLMLGQGPPSGYSSGWHDHFASGCNFSYGEKALNNLTPFVLEWADFAEQYDVEIYMPVLEPIMWASLHPRYWEMNDSEAEVAEDLVSNWMQNILPLLRERYSGTLMFATHNRVDNNPPIFILNFTGYDIVCSWEEGEDVDSAVFNICSSCPTCNGVVHHRTMYIGGLSHEPAYELSLEQQAENYNSYFQNTWNNDLTVGIMLDLGVGKEYRGRPAEDVIQSWLNDTEKVSSHDIDVLWDTEGLFELMDSILSPDFVMYSDQWI